MRQIAFRQVRRFSRLFSWNSFTHNEVGRPTCNGNLNSHIVPKTAINVNVLYKCVTQNIYNDERSNKGDATNNATPKTVETISIFSVLIKLMKARLNEVLNKLSREPQTIVEFVSWKLRELLLSAIIATGVSCREAHGGGAADSCLHRCTSSLSGYLFSRHPSFTMDTPFTSYLARSATLGVSSSLIARLHAFKSQPVECEVKRNPPSPPGKSNKPTDLKGSHGTLISARSTVILHMVTLCTSVKSGVSRSFMAHLHTFNAPRAERDINANPPGEKPPDCTVKESIVSTKDNLLRPLCEKSTSIRSKVSVVGIGQVEMAAIISMFTQGVANEIAMIDMRADKLEGEALDLLHGPIFVNNPKVTGSSDYSVSAGSKICIICAGVRQKDKETRLDLVQRNTEVLKEIIPELVKHNPDALYIVATNPVDILAYITWKVSGLPKNRVIGSGTLLDSARFRYLIAKRLGIASTSIDAYIIGEHGNSMVPVWSGVNIAGVRLKQLNPVIGTEQDPDKWKDIHTNLLNAAYNVRGLKGFTSWATIGLSLAKITEALLTDSNRVYTGMQGIDDEVFLSVPSDLCHEGVSDIVHQVLTENENEQLQKSAKLMAQILSDVKIQKRNIF